MRPSHADFVIEGPYAPRRAKSAITRPRFDEPVEVWAVSRRIEAQEATKVEDFWEPSAWAAQRSD